MGISWTGTHMNSIFTPKCSHRSAVFKNVWYVCIQCVSLLSIGSCSVRWRSFKGLIGFNLGVKIQIFIGVLCSTIENRKSFVSKCTFDINGLFWRSLLFCSIKINSRRPNCPWMIDTFEKSTHVEVVSLSKLSTSASLLKLLWRCSILVLPRCRRFFRLSYERFSSL